ncbi:MAG: hypothetical protein AB7E12_13420 [Burkholderiaceae bacterium]
MNTPRPVSLCTLIRAAFVLVVALAWLLRSLVPAGYMPANNDTLSQGVFANLTVCSQGLQWAPHPSPQAPDFPDTKTLHCAPGSVFGQAALSFPSPPGVVVALGGWFYVAAGSIRAAVQPSLCCGPPVGSRAPPVV